MNNAFKAEPSVIIGAVTALLTAVIAVATAYGYDMSEDQKNATLGLVGPVVGIIFLMSVVIRQFVYSPKTMEREAKEAYAAGTPPTDPQPEIPPPGQV